MEALYAGERLYNWLTTHVTGARAGWTIRKQGQGRLGVQEVEPLVSS